MHPSAGAQPTPNFWGDGGAKKGTGVQIAASMPTDGFAGNFHRKDHEFVDETVRAYAVRYLSFCLSLHFDTYVKKASRKSPYHLLR